ncbi:phage minor head protein, partial [Candidatus Magnetaquicoccus inordinatus]|uniref:phage head morphogenesis protein n=1 Tax=Candidatus Magnetaquicoccus inordinatus TaxID=2496818 RepID=UPI00102CE826
MAKDPIDLAFVCRLPPEKAIEYFRSKGYQITWDWTEVWRELHAKAFTVAKAGSLDILQTIRQHLDQALAEGKSEKWFIDTLTPILQEKGWWGRQTLINPAGEEQSVQLGSAWRLHTIYQTNIQAAYMAGRYREQLENSDHRPYWMYVAVIDGRTRPAHAALDGSVFRFDDPIWATIYPPNGWNCRCSVRA